MKRYKAVLLNDTAGQKHFGCDLGMRILRNELMTQGIDVIFSFSAHDRWEEHLPYIKFDVLIVNGEGTLHHTGSRPHASRLCKSGVWAQENCIPAFLINATLEGLGFTEYQALTNFQHVYVRDSQSQFQLQEYNKKYFAEHSSVVPDLTLAHTPVLYDDVIYADIVFIDSVVKDVSVDLGVARNRIREGMPDMSVTDVLSMNPFQFSDDLLQGANIVITGRYHVLTMCLLNQIPFIAVQSNTHKVYSLLYDVLGPTLAERRHKHQHEVHEIDVVTTQALMAFTDEEQEKLTSWLTDVKWAIRQMFLNIRKKVDDFSKVSAK